MKQVFQFPMSKWMVVALVAVGCQCVSLVPHARADEVSDDVTARSSSAISSAAGGENAGSALAITRRDGDDGSRVVQVIEDDKMIRISQRPGKGVVVIVVETVRDTEKVHRYTAPNLDALKARHSRGYELYQRYANSDPMVADVEASTKGAVSPKEGEMRRELEARYQAQLRQMQQQMMRQQQARFPQQGAMQRTGTAISRGAWGGASAGASASATASASAHASGSSSSSSSQSGRKK